MVGWRLRAWGALATVLFAVSFRVCADPSRRRPLIIRNVTPFERVAENTPIEPDQGNTCEGSARTQA